MCSAEEYNTSRIQVQYKINTDVNGENTLFIGRTQNIKTDVRRPNTALFRAL